MSVRLIAVITALVLAFLVVATLIAWGANAAGASPPGACPEWQAERDVAAARTAVRKAEARLAEAKRVLTATRTYEAAYGPSVARWVRLARRVGWGWPQVPTLMAVTYRESRGDPSASNGGVYRGLLQVWREHVADPDRLYEPAYNLRTGLRLWRGASWEPWR